MGSKQVSIVVDLRTGKDVIHVPYLITILSAAGYKPDVALKAYGGETLKLVRKAAREGCGLVIGYRGDGTLNNVVNGVMDAGGKSLIGDIPGGSQNSSRGHRAPSRCSHTFVASRPRARTGRTSTLGFKPAMIWRSRS